MNQKNIITILIVIIILLGAAFGYVLIIKKEAPVQTDLIDKNGNKKACPAMARQCPDGSSIGPSGPNCEFAPCPGEQSGQTGAQSNLSSDTTPLVQNSMVYTNDDYGFQITIPAGYPDWKAMVEKDYGGKGVTYIHMIFKTKDSQWSGTGEENFVTHEKFPGYASIFAFTVWDKGVYKQTVEDCKKEPNPDCPSIILGQNNLYVFDVSLGNGVPPKDLENLRNLLNSSGDMGKALNFKIINK
jgi:hypothetical protein